MNKKYWLVALFTLTMTFSLCLATRVLAAPDLIGNWAGTAPKITTSGCSNESITVTITKQCTNLFSGTVLVGTTSVPVVGKFNPTDYTVYIIGNLQNISNYTFAMVILSGAYVAGNPPSITVSSFMHSTLDINSQNVEYDNFSLIKK